ncbi:hypothetical protein EJB05_17766, partial [Eragrostis curvula]
MDGLHTELALGLIRFGCSGGGGGGGDQLQTAPFVAKTYQMVCDPRTDAFVRWGRENNSFVVVDPAGFSQLLLPCFFKHSNFSSFVRQLNTYGFRKVHPDRWEFAHESFLRGQTRLLPRIVRRKKRGEGGAASCSSSSGGAAAASLGGDDACHRHHQEGADYDDDDDEEKEALAEEVQKLRQEQAAIGEELARMSRRLQATERRPDQLMSFLARLAEDPDGVTRPLMEQAAEKKRRRLRLNVAARPPAVVSPLPPPPPPPMLALGGAGMDWGGWQWAEQKPAMMLPSFDPTASCGVQQVPDFAGGVNGGGAGLTTDLETPVDTPFPFCLLGQGFF